MKEIFIERATMGLGRNLKLKISQEYTTVIPAKTSAILEREPKLAFFSNLNSEYSNIHHRTIIQQLTKPNAKVHNQPPGRAPEIQSREKGGNI